jgi:hypothetical protein
MWTEGHHHHHHRHHYSYPKWNVHKTLGLKRVRINPYASLVTTRDFCWQNEYKCAKMLFVCVCLVSRFVATVLILTAADSHFTTTIHKSHNN